MMEKAVAGELRQPRKGCGASASASSAGSGGVAGMKGGFLSGKGGALAAEADGRAQAARRDQEELDLLKSLSSLPRRLDPPAGPRPLLCACLAADARWRRHAPCQCPRRTT